VFIVKIQLIVVDLAIVGLWFAYFAISNCAKIKNNLAKRRL
jgi:hypothetical protein